MQRLLAHRGWGWKTRALALMEALEARVHMSATTLTTRIIVSTRDAESEDWVEFPGHELTLPETQIANVLVHAYTSGAAGHRYHFKFSATHNGQDVTSLLPPSEGDALINDHDTAL